MVDSNQIIQMHAIRSYYKQVNCWGSSFRVEERDDHNGPWNILVSGFLLYWRYSDTFSGLTKYLQYSFL